MKKFYSAISCAMGVLMLGGTLAACGYVGDYSYEAIDPGTLAAPRAEYASAEEDAAKNAAYRREYPTLERYPETVTIKVAAINYDLEGNVKVGTTPENQSFNKIALDKLNIKLEYKVVAAPSQYDNLVNLSIAGGVMPDMFYTTQADMFATLRDQNMLADLTEAYYMLNDNLLHSYIEYMPEVVKACMKEGKLYALPQQTNRFATAQRLYIRKDWLEIAGVEAPTTVDEMIAVGEAFIAHKSEIAQATGISTAKVIPLAMHKDLTYSDSYGAKGLFNAHGVLIDGYFMGEDGQLYCSNTSPEAQAAVETMRTMYEKGILHKEFLSNTAANVQSFVSAGFVGMVFGEWWLPKDSLENAVKTIDGADWVWVDLPATDYNNRLPIVDTMLISGYNLVSKNCKHPEAVAKLINLFYDIYYNDNAQDIYGTGVLPSNGFYYQFVPMKIWDGMDSAVEYRRVQSVFNTLYDSGLNDRAMFQGGLYEALTEAEIQALEASGKKVYRIAANGSKYDCIKPSVIDYINANSTLKAAFNTMRNREKILHFADGYPYFVAYKKNVATKDMTKEEKKGWGIYHEMIDPNGSYAYVVDLADGTKPAKYNEFYGTALSAMADYGGYVTTQTSVYFTKMISGESSMSAFNEFVKDFNKNGGKTIVNQVNAWYKAVHAFDE